MLGIILVLSLFVQEFTNYFVFSSKTLIVILVTSQSTLHDMARTCFLRHQPYSIHQHESLNTLLKKGLRYYMLQIQRPISSSVNSKCTAFLVMGRTWMKKKKVLLKGNSEIESLSNQVVRELFPEDKEDCRRYGLGRKTLESSVVRVEFKVLL